MWFLFSLNWLDVIIKDHIILKISNDSNYKQKTKKMVHPSKFAGKCTRKNHLVQIINWFLLVPSILIGRISGVFPFFISYYFFLKCFWALFSYLFFKCMGIFYPSRFFSSTLKNDSFLCNGNT